MTPLTDIIYYLGVVDLSPRIHPLDKAIARPRKNAKRNDKNLWRFTLILK